MTDINQASQPLGGEEVVSNIGRANRHGTATGLSMNSSRGLRAVRSAMDLRLELLQLQR